MIGIGMDGMISQIKVLEIQSVWPWNDFSIIAYFSIRQFIKSKAFDSEHNSGLDHQILSVHSLPHSFTRVWWDPVKQKIELKSSMGGRVTEAQLKPMKNVL